MKTVTAQNSPQILRKVYTGPYEDSPTKTLVYLAASTAAAPNGFTARAPCALSYKYSFSIFKTLKKTY